MWWCGSCVSISHNRPWSVSAESKDYGHAAPSVLHIALRHLLTTSFVPLVLPSPPDKLCTPEKCSLWVVALNPRNLSLFGPSAVLGLKGCARINNGIPLEWVRCVAACWAQHAHQTLLGIRAHHEIQYTYIFGIVYSKRSTQNRKKGSTTRVLSAHCRRQNRHDFHNKNYAQTRKCHHRRRRPKSAFVAPQRPVEQVEPTWRRSRRRWCRRSTS